MRTRESVVAFRDQIQRSMEQANPEATPTSPPVDQSAESSVTQAETPTQAQAQEPHDPATLTGNESEDELKQLGYSDRVRERIQTLARERNQFQQEAERMQQEQNARAAEADQPPRPQTRPGANGAPVFEFPDPPPEDASFEEEQDYKMRKMVWETANQVSGMHNMEMAKGINTIVGPMLQEHYRGHREAEWGEVEGVLNRTGLTREEIEPAVNSILQNAPDRGVKDAVFQTLVALGGDPFSAPAAQPRPEVPVVSVPGGGRVAPASQDAPSMETDEERKAATLEAIRLNGAEGNSAAARRHARNFWADKIGKSG